MESDCKELQVTIEHMNMKRGGGEEELLTTMERKQKLVSGVPEDLRERLFKEVRILDDRISAEEAELCEKRAEMVDFLKESRRTKAEERRASGAVRSDVAQRAASGAQRVQDGGRSL